MPVLSISVIPWLKLLIVLVVPIFLLCWTGLYRFLYLASKIQGPSLWSLVTVHAKQLFSEDGLMCLCKLCAENGFKPFRIWIGFQYSVILSDPEAMSVAFKSKYLTEKSETYYRDLSDYTGRGSLVVNGAEWKRHRSSVAPAFHKNVLESHLPTFNAEAKSFVRQMYNHSKGEEFDVTRDFREFTYLISWKSVIAKNAVYTDIRLFCEALSKILHIVQLKTFNPFYYWLFYRFRPLHSSSKSHIQELLRDLFEKSSASLSSVEERITNTENFRPETVLEYIIKERYNGNALLNDQEITDELKTLLGAASETTATTSSIAVLLLALYPDEQMKVREEVRRIFGDSDRPVTSEDLKQLECLERVIKETLRLFPAVPAMMRRAAKEVNICGTIVPKETAVIIMLVALHRNPASFPNPHEFIPDRFLSGTAEERHPFAYLPFSHGQRNCTGRAQAMIQMKVLLSTLFRRYMVVPGKGLKSIDDIKVKLNVTLRLRKSLVKLIPLEHSECERNNVLTEKK